MPRIIETTETTAQGTVGTLNGSDLSQLASEAQRRQQEATRNNPIRPGQSQFPIQDAPGSLDNLLGRGQQADREPESSGSPLADFAAPSPTTLDDVVLPVAAPQQMEPEPQDTSYAELSPTQRNRAITNLEVDVVDYVANEEGRAITTQSGAALLAIDPRYNGSPQVFLAEDGIAAQAALFQLVERLGVNATVETSDSIPSRDQGYATEWQVPAEQFTQFRRLVDELGESRVDIDGDRVRVTFDRNNRLNRFFNRNPFGSTREQF